MRRRSGFAAGRGPSCWSVPTASRPAWLREGGGALVAVLGIASALAHIVLFVVFTVALDTIATANARDAALAGGQAEAALVLGVESTSEALAAGESVAGRSFGPWPGYGIDGSATTMQLDASAVIVRTSARVGRSLEVRSAILSIDQFAGPAVLSRP